MNLRLIRIGLIATSSILLFGCKTTLENSSDPPKTEVATPSTETQDEKKSVYSALQALEYTAIDEVISFYYALKGDSPTAYNFDSEYELNRYGYALLAEGKTKDAIEIFKLLVSEFPAASNPYDSLGEAYKKDGNDAFALINFEKSVELNPKNYHAIDQITILKGLELLVTDWGKEFFHFPLHFAEEIPYQGVEEAVFPKNWINPDSSDYFSYVIAWSLEHQQTVTVQELNRNFKLYFDGLIGGLSRVDTTKFTEAEIHFEANNDPTDSVSFTGQLHIFDGFVTQEPLTLNARAYMKYCEEKDQLILLFRFSPLPYNDPIWNKLRTVKLRTDVCQR